MAGVEVVDVALLVSGIAEVMKASDRDDAVSRVCALCTAALPCDGAAMTVMTSDVRRETIYASNDVIGHFERVQYGIGEGPSLLAFTTRRPVLIPDLTHASAAARWPGLASQMVDLPLRAVFCFPMRFGAINVGVCVLYRRATGMPSSDDVALFLEGLDLTTLALLELREGSMTESLLDHWLAVDGGSRRQVHQATGMLIAQLGVPAEVAFARLRGYAFSDGRNIEEVADDIVNRRLRLEPDPA